ncbi:hypothetical protein RHGRI_011105 [Rhododendron griersonianum]|uniref:Ubiquitin-like protease family profile domain-containing protein n=1 Tax=Rhododendron griersonianum TaxID=479676 RepID=A0AAV6KKS5_9ERIC|nr:hypothetical protein RHGRI_011105 [Rhododendron griersonianum]
MDDVVPKWKVEKTKLGKLLEEEDKALLNLFYDLNQGHVKTMKSDVNVQTDDEICHILLAMIIYCDDKRPSVGLFVNDMGNEVIDGYTSMLKREQEVKRLMHGNNAFFTSSCWTLITMGNQSSKKYLIDSKLEQLYDELHDRGLDYFWYLVFSMNSSRNKTNKNSPYHWTVLVYDMQEQEWKQYNSLKLRKKEKSGDPYLKDAAIVVKNLHLSLICLFNCL